ncbi:Alkaline phosphatase synthesis sensor protein PhoR [compost metagenome]
MWNNLISNAIKFTDPGGQITVSLQKSNGGATVQIADTGCGMSPEVGRHVFEKFYQGDKAHATEGNGLGLALVKRVIDIVGADIKVESIYGQGSVFTVTLF